MGYTAVLQGTPEHFVPFCSVDSVFSNSKPLSSASVHWCFGKHARFCTETLKAKDLARLCDYSDHVCVRANKCVGVSGARG